MGSHQVLCEKCTNYANIAYGVIVPNTLMSLDGSPKWLLGHQINGYCNNEVEMIFYRCNNHPMSKYPIPLKGTKYRKLYNGPFYSKIH